jgi:hypothetical protein
MNKVIQIPALFLPKKDVHEQKSPLNKSPSVNINNNKRSTNVQKKNDVKSAACLLRTMQERTDIKGVSGIR